MESIEDVKRITACRVCGSARLETVVDLGVLHISDFPRKIQERHPAVGLDVVQCGVCGLLQLRDTSPREWMYREYFYRSGLNESMVAALRDVVAKATFCVDLKDNDTVIDIGANDGTLLKFYGEEVQRIAFEPALNLQKELAGKAEMVVADFFPPEVRYDGPKAKIITSIAMFYDLEEPAKFVAEIRRVLHEEGVWVCQFTDLWAMLETNAWDSICHEHLCYYSFSVFAQLLAHHGLAVLDVERNTVNGGSVRYYVVHRESAVKAPAGATERLQREISQDQQITPARLQRFVAGIEECKKKVNGYIEAEVYKGTVVDVLGASTKGNTLLQYFGLDSTCIRRAVDRNSDKDGRYCVGSWIPVVLEKEGHVWPAGLFVVLPWHFKEGLVQREQRFLNGGGKLLFPLPHPVVVSKEGEIAL